MTAAPTPLSHAVARYIRMSPQKSRLVADLIRDRLAGEALTILRFSERKKISAVIEKVLRSAIAVGLLDLDEELDRPCGQCAQEFRMATQEHSEVVR